MNETASNEFHNDLSSIVGSARKNAYQKVDRILVIRNWLLGKSIAEELTGVHGERSGEKIVSESARTLTEQCGKGFDRRSLYRYMQFYKTYPKIMDSLMPQSLNAEDKNIADSLRTLFLTGVMMLCLRENCCHGLITGFCCR